MLPAVGFAGHDDGVVCGVADCTAASVVGHVRKRVVGFVAAVPDFLCGGGCDVAEPDGPGMRAIRFDEVAFGCVARRSRPADKSDALAVKGPLRRRVAVYTRRKKLHRFLLHVVDGDEAVVVARGSESEKIAVGRPGGFTVAAAGDDLKRFGAAVEWRNIELAVAGVGDYSVCGNDC